MCNCLMYTNKFLERIKTYISVVASNQGSIAPHPPKKIAKDRPLKSEFLFLFIVVNQSRLLNTCFKYQI